MTPSACVRSLRRDVPFGVDNPDKYLEGREATYELAVKQGYLTDSFVIVRSSWGDEDKNKHVNNVVFFRWLEDGRLTLTSSVSRQMPILEDGTRLGSGAGKGVGMILGSLSNRYLSPVIYPDHVLVAHKVKKLGEKTIDLESAIFSFHQKRKVCDGTAVLHMYDYDALKAIPLLPEMRGIYENYLDSQARQRAEAREAKL